MPLTGEGWGPKCWTTREVLSLNFLIGQGRPWHCINAVPGGRSVLCMILHRRENIRRPVHGFLSTLSFSQWSGYVSLLNHCHKCQRWVQLYVESCETPVMWLVWRTPDTATNVENNYIYIYIYNRGAGAFLVVQWLRFHAPHAGGQGSILGQGTWSCMPQLRVHMLQLKVPHGAMKVEGPACHN